MNLKKAFTLKRILLALAIVILLLCIACVSVLLIQHHKKLERFNKAKQAYMDEKYEDAKPLLRECLNDQYNDEEVNVMLAKIAENEEEWPQAVWHWQRASKLNPFKQEYTDAYLNSMMMTRDFALVAEALNLRESQNPLTQEQYLMLAYCNFQLRKQDAAKEAFEKITDEGIKKKELAAILAFYLNDTPHTIGQALDFLKPFHNSSDKFVAFETLYASANSYARIRDLDNGKSCMEKAAEVSPLVGKALQAEYLYSLGIISEAIVVLEECTKKYTSNEMGAMLGECYTITGQTEKLAELQKKFQTGNNNRITTGLYLEALHAYLTRNQDVLIQNITKWQDNFISPIATLVKLYAATCADDLEATKTYLNNIPHSSRPSQRSEVDAKSEQVDTQNENAPKVHYFNIQDYAFAIGMGYVETLVAKNQPGRAAEVAEILEKFEIPPLAPNQTSPARLLSQLVIGLKLAQNKLTQTDIDNTLQKFPGDPLILNYISRYYLEHGEFDKAIQFAQSNLKRLREVQQKQSDEGKPTWDLTPFVNQLLGSLESNYIKNREEARKLAAAGKTNEAKKLADEAQRQLNETKKTAKSLLLEKDKLASNILYIDFCFRNRLADELNEYSADIKPDDSDDIKALKYFARAQIAMLPDSQAETEQAKQPEANQQKLTEEEQKKLVEAEQKKQAETLAKQRAEVSKHLDNIITASPAVLFKVALLYSAVHEFAKGNATYQKIIDQSKATDIIYLNMSENLSALEQNEKALEYAKKALDMSPDNSVVRETYAIRLFENGGEEELKQAFDHLDAIVMNKKATNRGLYVWYSIMQDKIAKALEAKDWTKIRTEANHLLIVFPKDERASEALKQVETLMKDEIEKEAAEKKEAEKETENNGAAQ